jgi:hypothetical protein
MFAAPRFIAIDDNPDHLAAIVKAIHSLGTTCFGINYDGSSQLDAAPFVHVRCLFTDLHLLSGIASTNEHMHYALIAQILETTINRSGGPFILVVWTDFADRCHELREYLETHLIGDCVHARPLAVLGLSKATFINPTDNTVSDPKKLEEAVRNVVASIPQLAALIEWEENVLAAAGATLATLINLVPESKRINAQYASELDTILSRLACEAIGKHHVATDPRGAITQALVPILADRILNQEESEAPDIWKAAITKHGSRPVDPASPEEAGQLNRMLHLALPEVEHFAPADWGAVTAWPYEWSRTAIMPLLGLTGDQMLGSEFKIDAVDRDRCAPRLVRIGAACDYTQNRSGPITYLFGMEIPEDAKRKTDKDGHTLRMTDAIWQSPLFVTPSVANPFRLHVHFRFSINLLPTAVTAWAATYRLREQLLMQLITTASVYSSRPGIVRF